MAGPCPLADNAGNHPSAPMPARIHARHTIQIALAPDDAFALFTPAGEERWVDGWAPLYVHPADGRTEAGMVFETGEGDERTVWMLLDLDAAAHRVRYARVTPASRTGTVEVACTAIGAARTQVTVTYLLTALSEAGATMLEGFEGARFAAMIDGWRTQIERHLAGP